MIHDLRSDTVTRPDTRMRQAMAAAVVGDDVYGEDPTVRELEETVAALLGKPAALFVPSGTMANQLALLAQTHRGDEVIVGQGAHIAWHESGAAAAWAGVQFAFAGQGGIFDEAEMLQQIKPPGSHYPRTSMVCLENTHNLAGGQVFPQAKVSRVAAAARARQLALHLDGARLWNASAASGVSLDELCAPFDSISTCFSKGLGAPVGSALVASSETISSARRYRKMLGGGMRQAGILAAGALFALRHHLADIPLDHAKAARFAAVLTSAGVLVTAPETNIVNFRVAGNSARFVERAASEGVLLNPISDHTVRAVTHRDLSEVDVEQAAHTVVRCAIRNGKESEP